MSMQYTSSMEACINLCDMTSGCIVVSWVFSGGACYMKNSIVSASANSGVWGAIQVKAAASDATATSTATSTSTTSFDYTIPTSNDLYPSVRKRGLAYNDASLTHFFNGFKVSWAYNWYSAPVDSTSHPSAALNLSQTFVPMLWSDTSDLTSVWAANAQAALDAGADHLLAFNEPDQCGDGLGGQLHGFSRTRSRVLQDVDAAVRGPCQAGRTRRHKWRLADGVNVSRVLHRQLHGLHH